MKISMPVYRDKILGAWLGKSAGGIIGSKQENNKNMLHYSFENVFPDVFPPNDDFDLQVLWLYEILEKKGVNFDSYDLAQEFCKRNICWANEYRVAINNIDRALWPPLSGMFDNEYFNASMGCPIRSEVWALIAPANPRLAMRFAGMDGVIDHGNESVEGEKFLAGLEADAFAITDIRTLIERAMARIDSSTALYACIDSVLHLAESGLSYEEIRNELVRRFGSCDASYSVINLGFMMLALLLGKGDFEKTLLLAVNCGFDTDCTAATVGAVIGIIKGYNALPAIWRERIGSTFTAATVNVDQSRNTYAEVAELTAMVGLQIWRDGLNKEIEFEGQEGIVTNIPFLRRETAVTVTYLTTPVVFPGQECKFKILIDLAEANMRGELTLKLPDTLQTERTHFRIDAEAGNEIEVSVRLCNHIEYIPEKNVIETVYNSDSELISRRVGVIGASPYKIYGPFFDQYDSEKYDHNIYGELMQRDEKGILDIYAMFNGFVNIRKPYIDENFENLDELPYTILYSGKHMLELEDNIGYRGPCCLYVVRDLYVENEETAYLLIGNNAPYKMWLNGDLIEYCDVHIHYMMQNRQAVLHLKKGKNRLIFKVIRTDTFKFSTFLSKLEYGFGGVYVDVKSKL